MLPNDVWRLFLNETTAAGFHFFGSARRSFSHVYSLSYRERHQRQRVRRALFDNISHIAEIFVLPDGSKHGSEIWFPRDGVDPIYRAFWRYGEREGYIEVWTSPYEEIALKTPNSRKRHLPDGTVYLLIL